MTMQSDRGNNDGLTSRTNLDLVFNLLEPRYDELRDDVLSNASIERLEEGFEGVSLDGSEELIDNRLDGLKETYCVVERPELEEKMLNNMIGLQREVLNLLLGLDIDVILLGGAIRDVVMDITPSDLDFSIISSDRDKVLDSLSDRFEDIETVHSDEHLITLKIEDLKIDIMVGELFLDLGCYADFSVNLLFYAGRARFGLWTGDVTALNGSKVSSVDEVVEEIKNRITRQIEMLRCIGQDRIDKMNAKGFEILIEPSYN